VLTEEEIRAIYHDTIDTLYGYVSRRCGGERARAEDIVQETWLRAVREWRRQGAPARPVAWLTTVARNLLLNELRRPQPVRLDAVPASAVLDAAEDLATESADVARIVNQALERLPARQRSLLEAFHYRQHSVSQIAGLFAVSERAIEGRLRRARQNLRRELQAALERQECRDEQTA